MQNPKKFLTIAAVLLAVMVYYVFLVPFILQKTSKPLPSPSALPSVSASASPGAVDIQPTVSPVTSDAPQPSATPTPKPTPTPAPTPAKEPERQTASSDLLSVTYTTWGASIDSAIFLPPPPDRVKEGYRDFKAPDAREKKQMQILARLREARTSFRLLFNNTSNPEDFTQLEEDGTVYELETDPTDPTRAIFTGKRGDLRIRKIFTLSPTSYEINLEVEITNEGEQEASINYLLVGAAGIVPEGIEDLRQTLEFNIGNIDPKGYHVLKEFPIAKLPEDGSIQYVRNIETLTVDWVAVSSHFFSVFLNPNPEVQLLGSFARRFDPQPSLARLLPTFKADMANIESGVVVDTLKLAAGESKTHTYSILPTPKLLKILNKYEDLEYSKVVKLGFFGLVARLILNMLDVIVFLVGNYGVAIIILTIIIQILMHPLTRKQYTSMMKMQKLQPLIKEAQSRFKKDQKKLGEVTMAIYQHTGVNPLGGCLPLLLQLPIFFALYSAFYSCIELRHAPFLWVTDLSGTERLPLGTVLPLLGDTINILPFLMTAVWFVQQSTTPKPSDPNQMMTYRIMQFMPLVFFFLFYSLPSGLVLYWFVRNLVYIGETLWIKRDLKKQEESGKMNFDKITLDTILNNLKANAKARQRKP